MDCTNNLCYGSTDSTGKKHIDVWKTFAPGFLAKQEARLKRKALERELKQVAHALGQVANSSHTLSENPSITPQSLNIQVALIAGALHSENNTEQADSLRANLSSLTSILSSSSSRTSSILSSNARPSFWEQVWPRFAAYPLIFYIAARQIHKNQDAIWQALVDAKETARGFFVSWVVEPVSKILDTIRGKGGLSLTGRQSLASDLDSLERMVLDFDREVYKMNDSQLQQVSAKLREGDLSEVLQAWETDIKVSLMMSLLWISLTWRRFRPHYDQPFEVLLSARCSFKFRKSKSMST